MKNFPSEEKAPKKDTRDRNEYKREYYERNKERLNKYAREYYQFRRRAAKRRDEMWDWGLPKL